MTIVNTLEVNICENILSDIRNEHVQAFNFKKLSNVRYCCLIIWLTMLGTSITSSNFSAVRCYTILAYIS